MLTVFLPQRANRLRPTGKGTEQMAKDGMDNDSGGLFNISISDSEGEDGGIDTSHGIASSSKKDRTGQSEDAFRAVKSGYRAKVENGEVSQQCKQQ